MTKAHSSNIMSEWWKEYTDKYKDNPKKKYFSWIFLIMIVIESLFLFLQAGKLFASQSAKDIDLTAFIILCVVNALWVVYGLWISGDLPIVISGILYVIGSILIIVCVILYGDT